MATDLRKQLEQQRGMSQGKTGFAAEFKGLGLIILFLVLLPIIIFGFAAVFKVIQLMNSPIISGYVPAWALIVGAIIIYLFVRRRN